MSLPGRPDPVDAAETDIDCAVRLSAEVADLVRGLAQRDGHHPATLWIITRGVCEAVSDAALRQSCLWGSPGSSALSNPSCGAASWTSRSARHR